MNIDPFLGGDGDAWHRVDGDARQRAIGDRLVERGPGLARPGLPRTTVVPGVAPVRRVS